MTRKNTTRSGIARILAAFRCSMTGLGMALRHEAAFRQETALAVFLIPLGIALGNTAGEKALLCSAVLLVLMVELLNSGIEAVVDRIGPEFHELSGRAKDLGSAAVLLSLVNAAVTWLVILWPRG